MKKVLSVICVVFSLIPVFSATVSAQLNLGYGAINGTRYETTYENQHNIKANGIELGTVLSYRNADTKEGWGIEAYFDYLFALKGSWSKEKAPKPDVIPQGMKYTDYKAGLGAQYRHAITAKDTLKLSCGLNFAGVSNHTYIKEPKKIENQIEGHKVTSFGLYLDAGCMHDVKDNLALTAGIHSCINPLGIIRNFDTEKHGWVNYLNIKSRTKCFTCFAQFGLMYSLNI